MLSEAQRSELRTQIAAWAAEGHHTALLDGMRELLRDTPRLAADTSFCHSVLIRLHDQLTSLGRLKTLRTFVVRSVTLEPMVPALRVAAALQSFWLEVTLGDYGSYLDDLTNPEGALARNTPDLVLIVLDLQDIAADLVHNSAPNTEPAVQDRLAATIDLLATLLSALRTFSKARIVLQGFEVPDRTAHGDVADANLPASLPNAVAELNRRMAQLCRRYADCVSFDVDRVAARFGRSGWRDPRLFLATRLPVAPAAHAAYSAAIVRSLAAFYRAPRKVLCTDLDNTLWGGVLGDEGWAGIATGTAFPGNCFQQYQGYLKQLAARGILLVAISKNNPQDVEEAFARRSADLLVTLEDFTARKIGWGDKTDALRELAEELALGLDSFVFVDDHPVECEAMRQQLPEVATLCLPANEPWRYVELLASQTYFDTLSITDADLKRSEEYRAQAKRSKAAGHATSRAEFLESLATVCTLLPVAEAPLARAVQLLGKTNQFNLTTRRHGSVEVEGFERTGVGFAVRVRDRFGDAGVVGLVLADTASGESTWRIDSFLLSCRVIGRGVETAMLAGLVTLAKASGIHKLSGEYIPSTKNAPCADFYSRHGFARECVTEDVIERYSLLLSHETPQVPAWIHLEVNPEEILHREPAFAEHPA